MENKKVYLSLPITGRNLNDVRKMADRMKAAVIAKGYNPISPLDIVPEDAPYNVAMGKCVEELLSCDYIFLSHDWQKSRGCKIEYFVAMNMKIKQLYLSLINY